MDSLLVIAVGYNLVYISLAAEGAENGLEFTIVRPFNWIGPRMDFIPGIDGPSEGVPRVLACFSNVSSIKCINVTSVSYAFFIADDVTVAGWQNLLRREPLKLVDGGESQRTFIYIRDAIEAVLLMIVCSYTLLIICSFSFNFLIWCRLCYNFLITIINIYNVFIQENPARANGHIFNVGNPNNEVTVRQLAEMMTKVNWFFHVSNDISSVAVLLELDWHVF